MQSNGVTILKREEGQSIIMITFILVVLIALMAVVVDVGNAYAQRRVVQNAADAAAMAGARTLALGSSQVDWGRVRADAISFAGRNGIDTSAGSGVSYQVWYYNYDPTTQAISNLTLVPSSGKANMDTADGVQVTVNKTFDTYLARVIGRQTMAAGATALGQVSKGACVAGSGGTGVFPMGISYQWINAHSGTTGFFTNPQTLSGSGLTASTSDFNFLYWGTGTNNTTTLYGNISDTSHSGSLKAGRVGHVDEGDLVSFGPDVATNSTLKTAFQNKSISELNAYKTSGQRVLVPIYDQWTTANQYHLVGFAWFILTDYSRATTTGSTPQITGRFVQDTVADSEGGCVLAGTSVVNLRPPMDLHRTIEGRVAYEFQKVEGPSNQVNYPVDVVVVMDTSGSMDSTWSNGSGGTEKKIVTARHVLDTFASKLRPEIGDRLGLVYFPKPNVANISPSYQTQCAGYQNIALMADVKNNLTGQFGSSSDPIRANINTLAANGGTPIADAMRLAYQMLSDQATPGHGKVIILASDGIANGTTDYHWTGISGSYLSELNGQSTACKAADALAKSQATAFAAQAKSQGVALFTIGIGDPTTTLDDVTLTNMATVDTDASKPHHFTASNSASLDSIYQSLGDRVSNFGGECTVTPVETAARGATVDLYQGATRVATATTDASGAFTISQDLSGNDIAPGVYTFQASITTAGPGDRARTYNILTDHIGGAVIVPQITVGNSAGTYSKELFLKTTDIPNCGGL